MTFDEGRSRMPCDHRAENFALLRRIAVSLVKQDAGQRSIRGKQKVGALEQ